MSRERSSQEAAGGTIHPGIEFQSGYVQQRRISLWLPPGYDSETDQRYPVIYAHDGQNLFDPQTAFVGVDWGMHLAMGRLVAKGTVRKALIVGIWNSPARYREYDPQKAFEDYLSRQEQTAYAGEHGQPVSDLYLQFIVRELKPYIDSRYRTLPARNDTLMIGSSMGGMISAYALCEYPEVFGGIACLSTHWPAVNGRMAAYLADRLPDPQGRRLYFDYGTATLDGQYEPFQLQVDEVLRQRGYAQGDQWVTRKFTGEDHSEQAWRRRVDIPLQFLLK